MADLDDFFAKKDKKRSKTKQKFSTTEEVAKKLESDGVIAKKVEKPAKKEKSQEGGDDPALEVNDQDEWKEFEEEKKDYTGLKIGNLTINPEADNGAGSDSNEQQQITYDEAGNEVEKKVGPWKRMEPTAVSETQPKVVEEVPVTTPNVVGGAYVPPSKRNMLSQPTTIQPSRLRSKAAPDIHNEEYFPTLSGGKDGKKGRNEGSFEVVSHNKSNSLRFVEQSKNSAQSQKLSLGNRFNSLSNDS